MDADPTITLFLDNLTISFEWFYQARNTIF